MNHRNAVLSGAFLLSLSLMNVGNAATPVDLSKSSPTAFSFMSSARAVSEPIQFVEVRRSQDANNKVHIRFQETYHGFPVWGADGIVHIKDHAKAPLKSAFKMANQKGSFDGTVYTNLAQDLPGTPDNASDQHQANAAIAHLVQQYQAKTATKATISDEKAERVIYIDDQNKAHWAYRVSFTVTPVEEGVMPAKPNYLVDAKDWQVYQSWNEIKTLDEVAAPGGGFGGNKKMGKLVYDGLKGHLMALKISRDDGVTKCTLQNQDVMVKGYRGKGLVGFDCKDVDPEHNNVYFDGELEAVNDSYSPPNDALFGGMVIKDFYQKWYGYEVLKQNGKPMMLTMVVHDPIDNAYWDGRQMTFGDGVRLFYALTSLGVAAHEISHGFTEQHSGLAYYAQSGGMNESFSDMAAQAAEQFAYGKASWQIGGEIFKDPNRSLRYMELPSKDCGTKKPGNWCSIDSAKQYFRGLDVHFSSGVYNRFFYNLGHAEGWDARKAFEVMIKANDLYWTSTTDFAKGACGVLKAAKDLTYDTKAVVDAFKVVDIETDNC